MRNFQVDPQVKEVRFWSDVARFRYGRTAAATPRLLRLSGRWGMRKEKLDNLIIYNNIY